MEQEGAVSLRRSASRHVQLTCDVAGCAQVIHTGYVRNSAAVKRAEAVGWTWADDGLGGTWKCPTHGGGAGQLAVVPAPERTR